jgi:hypothetical protein
MTLASKLGIKENNIVVCLHTKEQFFTKLRNQLPHNARISPLVTDKAPNVIIRFFNEHADFDASLRWLGKRLAPKGLIWAVLPKKSPQGRDLKKELLVAARKEGMLAKRTALFSNVETGTLLVKK